MQVHFRKIVFSAQYGNIQALRIVKSGNPRL
jgi:hypothetical protein